MTEPIKKAGAPAGNTNAKKDDASDSTLHIRCTKADKAKWVKAAQGNGGLSSWVIGLLNKNS
ncbi:MAG: hypothetical protein WBP13_00730 [Methylophilaceae bacterium]